ncbi:hypothetical protein AB0M43_37110 [Longispora sp. NPDC051575]|uniref:hypothetical protein n=1 Tax=Longispora sp. NPDC051575 TaxID=3154943 RepID=UPI00342CB557
MFEDAPVEDLAAWHNGRTGSEAMAVIVRRNPNRTCEVEVRTHGVPRLQEQLTEANAFALAADIRRAARGLWQRADVPVRT